MTIALAGLLKLCSMDTPSDRASAPQVIDERAVQLREFCQKLFGAACDEFKLGDRWPWLLHLRAKLDAPPALGTELADASLVLLSAAQMFLNFLLQVEVGKVTGLPCEKLEDHIDEEARSRISDAASDTDLARMKQFADEDSECDSNQTDSLRQDIRRRRQIIEAYRSRGWDLFQQQVDDAARVLASSLKPESADAAQLAKVRASLADAADPETIRSFKQWFSLAGCLGVLAVDDISLRAASRSQGPGSRDRILGKDAGQGYG